ncbi:MAG: HAD-IB family hydrolase [Paracoccus sp. (in: a-proteobacteria)]|nr:HAD-IB family hydrolase [Paracoccus sp. (in: a-proteobacteria)]
MTQRSCAFFDVDDTLIRIKSMFDFFQHWCDEELGNPLLYAQFSNYFAYARENGTPRTVLNRDYYRFFSGTEPDDLATAAQNWAKKRIGPDLFYPEAIDRLINLRNDGMLPVLVSGSFPELLQPIAVHLGVKEILSTKMQIGADGFYTGEIEPPQTIGQGKAEAIETFLKRRNVHPEDFWAFGDDLSDLPMLEFVGNPVVVGNGGELVKVAQRRNWPILEISEASTVSA